MHDIDSLFLPLATPGDILEISPPATGSSSLRVHFFDAGGAPLDAINPENNTLTKAWLWFRERFDFAPPLHVTVRKSVPHGAGLGGGSANAAALLRHLRGLAHMAGCALPDDDTFRRESAAVGADVPFFLLNRPARAQGVGEELDPLPWPFAGRTLLLVCPDIRVNTAWAFAELDRRRDSGESPPPFPRRPPFSYANDFEEPVFCRYPELAKLHAELAASPALLARMSGTGSSIFAVYEEKKFADAMEKTLASRGLRVYMHPLPQH